MFNDRTPRVVVKVSKGYDNKKRKKQEILIALTKTKNMFTFQTIHLT